MPYVGDPNPESSEIQFPAEATSIFHRKVDQMSTQGPAYHVDIVLCIDCTGSMSPVLDDVKQNALKFYSSVEAKMETKGKRIDRLRMRVIGYRDFYVDAKPIQAMPDFLDLRTESSQFESFVKSLEATGGGDEPESGLEGIALALKSNWSREPQAKARRIVVLWTDASAHPLEKAATSRPKGYPSEIPPSLDALTELWSDMPPASRRLLMYAPDAQPWSVIGASWGQTMHFPSQAGRGLEEVEFDAILDMIASSV